MSGDVEARLAALEARVAELEARLAAATGGPAEDDPWSRLGLREGERRIVTVLFADVSGFTALSERLDPEAFQLVMRETMSLLARCVTDEGGTIEKFIGDAVCAIFGAPVAHPDEPQRAARAALAMHRALEERAAEHPDLPPMRVHVGINTGPVIAGGVGDGSQFGAMGDTVNTAARIMDQAGEGETFVTAETHRRLRRWYRFEDRGLREVKGKAKPIAAYALVGERAAGDEAAGDGHGLDDVHVPLLGRDAELAELRALAAGVERGRGTTVLVLGEDGVGTSRLVRELAAELSAGGWRVLRGGARVHAETPLGLVATALGPLLDDDAGVRAGGASGPLAASLLVGGTAVPHDFELLLGEIVVAAAEVQPLLVVLDDASLADPGSIEVVRYLSRATTGARVLWALTGERIPTALEPLAGDEGVEILRVEPLAQEAVAAIIDAYVPGALDPARRARLAHLAEGSPQFAKEIVVALIDEGVVVEAGDGWTLAGDPDELELPGSVAELVEARIDQLGTATRVVLQDAAVIGMRFNRDLLARVATVPSAVDAALADLVDADLVVPPEQPGGLWSLRSRLLREVAYDSILRRRLPAAHRAVAEGLLALEPDRTAENADLLAHHFEASDDPPLAVPHLAVAVERAERAFNNTGTLERCRRALRIRDRFPGRVDDQLAARLLQRAGVSKLVLGDRTGMAELRSAVELREAVGPTGDLATLLERVGWYASLYGPRDEVAEHLARARDLAATLPGAAAEVVVAGAALTDALRAAAVDGDLLGAAAAVEPAKAVAAATGDLFLEGRAELVEGLVDLWSGRFEAAAESLRAAMDLAWANVFGTLADLCGRWLVLALADLDRVEDAVQVAEPILARADDRGSPSVACGVRAALARAWRPVDAGRARRAAAEAVAVAAAHDLPADAVTAVHLAEGMAWSAGAGADHDRADAALIRAEEVLAADADGWLRWRWSARVAYARGRVALARGDTEGALHFAAAVREAVAGVRAVDGAPEVALADTLEARARR